MNEYEFSDGYVKARGITANQKPLYRADVFDIIEATTTCEINIPTNFFEKKKFWVVPRTFLLLQINLRRR